MNGRSPGAIPCWGAQENDFWCSGDRVVASKRGTELEEQVWFLEASEPECHDFICYTINQFLKLTAYII